jgi:hypothetical protein
VGLVVIGAHWLEVDETGGSRLDKPDDKLRFEIKTLLRDGKVLIPVLANVVEPRWEKLPDELRALGSRQSIRITNATWDAGIQEIIRSIRQALKEARQDPPSAA